MADKKGYEPPPLGMLGMKLGQIAQKMGVGSQKGGFKLQPSPKTTPVKRKKYDFATRIWVYPYHDPRTKEEDSTLVTLKAKKHKVSAQEFLDRLKAIGVGLAVGHMKVVTGNKMHIAVVPKAEAKAASKAHPGALLVKKESKPREKWISAGCVVLDSLEDRDHCYIIKPSNHYGPWAFPKGRVDKGESIKQAAIREVWEETGLHVKILTGQGSYLGKKEGGFSFTHFFMAVKTGGTPHPTAETERVMLATWDEAKRKFKSSGNKRDPHVVDLAVKALQHLK